jgi:fructokinase
MSGKMVAVVESGGTKMVAALSRGPGEIIAHEKIPTTTPKETIYRLVEFFEREQSVHGKAEALAIGTFGPADLEVGSGTYGFITSTPKPDWSQTDLLGPIREAFGDVPVVFETDVNAALFGEASWGAAKGFKHSAYFTVGTGIGGSLMLDGSLVHGSGHPEMGHMRVTKHPNDNFGGVCSFHGDCLEGLASGPAIEKRWGKKAEELPADHPAWVLEAYYLAQACVNVLMIAPVEKIILGGGVMHQEQLLVLVRQEVIRLVNGYLKLPDAGQLVVLPQLGDHAGILGCVALGQS